MTEKSLIRRVAEQEDLDPGLRSRLLKTLISHRADISDIRINTRLLNKLVMDYAKAEGKFYEMNRLKNKFLGIAAHDLRNPLTSIRGFSEFILNGDLGGVPDAQKEFVQMIHTLSSGMLELVNDLLDVSVIESGRLSLTKKPADINAVLEERVRINAVMAEAKGIRITKEPSAVPSFPFDPARIGQVADNLISNAVKFSFHHTRIRVTAGVSGRDTVIRVEDQGPGLSEEDLKGVFGEFAKLSARPTGEEKSTGLGLAICKKIIEAHGGRIWAENLKQGGAAFSAALPMTGES